MKVHLSPMASLQTRERYTLRAESWGSNTPWAYRPGEFGASVLPPASPADIPQRSLSMDRSPSWLIEFLL